MMHRLRPKTSVASAMILHPPGYGFASLSVSGTTIAGNVCISYNGNRTVHAICIYEYLNIDVSCIFIDVFFVAMEARGCSSYMMLVVHDLGRVCRTLPV